MQHNTTGNVLINVALLECGGAAVKLVAPPTQTNPQTHLRARKCKQRAVTAIKVGARAAQQKQIFDLLDAVTMEAESEEEEATGDALLG